MKKKAINSSKNFSHSLQLILKKTQTPTFNSSIDPTPEQKKILNLIPHVDNLKIKAFAGSGKTTTLKMIAENFKDKKILYLAFNKAIAESAKNKFPRNVRISTVHSFAYAELIRLRKGKKFLLESSFNTYTINSFFDFKYDTSPELLEAIKLTFLLFCYSDFSDFNQKDFFLFLKENNELDQLLFCQACENLKKDKINFTFDQIENEKEKILKTCISLVNEIYSAMKEEKIPWTHDFYLKYFVEEFQERINDRFYDIVLLDEAQDSNPITLKLFKNFKGKKIMVGDPHQQIYSWRGSVNIMDDFSAETLPLSISFRFNQDIADKLNQILQLKGEENTIIGKGPVKISGKKTAFITRTNSTILKLIDFVDSFAITRDLKEIFKNVFIVEAIKQGQNYIPELGQFVPPQYKKYIGNFKEFVEDIKKRNDTEMKNAIALVSEYKITELYKKALKKYNNKAEIVFSTAHSAKGLEWEKVYVLDDFTNIKEKYQELVPFFDNYTALKNWIKEKNLDKKRKQFIEEINLYYVALSRGIKEVVDLTKNK